MFVGVCGEIEVSDVREPESTVIEGFGDGGDQRRYVCDGFSRDEEGRDEEVQHEVH